MVILHSSACRRPRGPPSAVPGGLTRLLHVLLNATATPSRSTIDKRTDYFVAGMYRRRMPLWRALSSEVATLMLASLCAPRRIYAAGVRLDPSLCQKPVRSVPNLKLTASPLAAFSQFRVRGLLRQCGIPPCHQRRRRSTARDRPPRGQRLCEGVLANVVAGKLLPWGFGLGFRPLVNCMFGACSLGKLRFREETVGTCLAEG